MTDDTVIAWKAFDGLFWRMPIVVTQGSAHDGRHCTIKMAFLMPRPPTTVQCLDRTMVNRRFCPSNCPPLLAL